MMRMQPARVSAGALATGLFAVADIWDLLHLPKDLCKLIQQCQYAGNRLLGPAAVIVQQNNCWDIDVPDPEHFHQQLSWHSCRL